MRFAEFADRLSAVVAPRMFTAIGLFALAFLVMAIAMFRARREIRFGLPLVLLTVFFGLCFYPFSALVIEPQQNHFIWSEWPPSGPEIVLLVLVVASLIAYWYTLRWPASSSVEDSDGAAEKSLSPYLYGFCCVVIGAFFVFYHLRDYAGDLHTWETTVIWGFADAFHRNASVWEYAAQCLKWDDGILSQGNTSLFYGVPTYALFRLAGFSVLTLRLCAAVLALLSALLFFVFCIRFFGRRTGTIMGCFLSVNTALLFYGRYGSSPTGMLVSLILVLYLSWLMIEKGKPTFWLSLAWVAALYAATLQYAPVRIFLLYAVGFVLGFFVLRYRNLRWHHYIIICMIVALITGVCLAQYHIGRLDYLFAARGEQFFKLANPGRVQQYLGLKLRPEEIGLGIRLRLGAKLLSITCKEYLGLVLPTILRPRVRAVFMETGLPPLYFAPLGLFILVGFVYSLYNFRKWRHFFLLIWVYYGSIPMLLTNRVDSHRLFLFVVPFSIWAGIGLWQFNETMKRLKTPKAIRHVSAVFLILCAFYANSVYLYYRQQPIRTNREFVQKVLSGVEGPVLLGAGIDIREKGALSLDLLERTRRSEFNESHMMLDNTLHRLFDGADEHGRITAAREIVKNMTKRDTLLLLPAYRFTETAKILEKNGLKVQKVGEDPQQILAAWYEDKP